MVSKYFTLLVLIIFAVSLNLSAQETLWNIPKDADERTAPFLFNDSTRMVGETVYMANCKSCHGDPGKANFSKLTPIPKDPASSEYQKHSDGAIFYIATTGKGLMPSFQNTLTEDQRWSVISYVRSFNKDYKQPAIKSENTAEIASTIKMSVSFDEKSKSVVAYIKDLADGKNLPVGDVSVQLFVKRTFGNLPVGQAKTNSNGKAIIPFPSDIPGDSIGNLDLIAIAGTTGKQIAIEQTEQIGVAVNPTNLLDERAWWNIRSMAPIWLIISYLSGGVAVGCTVFFVFLQLKKIKDINQIKESSHE